MSTGRRRIHPGDVVHSTFRARWRGVVVDYDDTGHNCVVVQVTHDRNGRPIRKPGKWWNRKVLGEGWLVKERP